MKSVKRTLVVCLCALAVILAAGCSLKSSSSDSSDGGSVMKASDVSNPDSVDSLAINGAKWQYDATNDIYYQIGVSYCTSPQAKDYESMGIYVPGKYMDAKANGDGTYTCTINASNKVGDYTAKTAPVVMPINTAGYAAQAAPTSYSANGITDYTKAGFVYVFAGCRGRINGASTASFDSGAPWGVTDLKAAVRCLRYNAASLPGDLSKHLFTMGMSGGGAQSALMGATGDSSLYKAYLQKIGAAMLDGDKKYISDAVNGSMCWCPITSLDVADEAYEWMMGQYATTDTRASGTWTAALSKDMAGSFADYINKVGLKADGKTLTLDKTDSGVYTSGSYYDYMKGVIENSLNNFLNDTTFPYTSGQSGTKMDGGFGGGASTGTGDASGGLPSGAMPSGDLPSGALPSGGMGQLGGGTGSGMGSGGGASTQESKTYQTVQEYIDDLNSDEKWITYDASTKKATITSVEAFVKHCKNATKSVGAFDTLDKSSAETAVFGNGSTDPRHFDATMAALLKNNASTYSSLSGYDASYATAYQSDMDYKDGLGTATSVRQNMYNPMFYLCDYYSGSGKSTVASYWRINTGIDQGDTSLTTEMNLALALKADKAVKSCDFTTVWGQQHTTAERTGDSTTNFIAWVNSCSK